MEWREAMLLIFPKKTRSAENPPAFFYGLPNITGAI